MLGGGDGVLSQSASRLRRALRGLLLALELPMVEAGEVDADGTLNVPIVCESLALIHRIERRECCEKRACC